jgi:hypothetical protein
MDFSQRKLPSEAAAALRICPVNTVKPFALMLAPVYVFMKRNAKFVAVKGPLDFFSAEELERLKTFELFYFPEFIDLILPFRQVARRVKALLKWDPTGSSTPLPPTPYEMSDGVLRIVGPLWSPLKSLESFFVSAFSDELCEVLPGDELQAARDLDLVQFERAVFISGWMVFLLLQLGVTELEYLSGLRIEAFRQSLGTSTRQFEAGSDEQELFLILNDFFRGDRIDQALGIGYFQTRKERIARKIASRMNRVAESLIDPLAPAVSTKGERGFING